MAFPTCITNLSGNFTKDCKIPPVIGLEENAFIIPYDDWDRAATLINAAGTIMTEAVLKATAQKIKVQAFKRYKDGGYDPKENPDAPDGTTHSFSFVSPKNDSSAKEFINALLSGTRCVVVVERKWKGTANADAFEVLGYDVGMTGTSTMKYYADSGSHVIVLKTPADEQEPRVPYTWNEGTYADTKSVFDAWAV